MSSFDLDETPSSPAPLPAVAVSEELHTHDKREIGSEAVWSLSSAKPGNGVEQLRDDSIESFWQYVHLLFAAALVWTHGNTRHSHHRMHT